MEDEPPLNGTSTSPEDQIAGERFKTEKGVPFHLLRYDVDPPMTAETGDSNLFAVHGLEDVYNKFCNKKIKTTLSSFLPNLPGSLELQGSGEDDSLSGLIEKPPVGGKELQLLSANALSSFRLMPGSVPEQFKFDNKMPEKRKKHKKHKIQEITGANDDANLDKKHRKKKKEVEGDKKKKKKEKKKKSKEKKPADGVGNNT